MANMCGPEAGDVGSLRLFRAHDLSDVEIYSDAGDLDLLALLLFLSRHAERRAIVVVREAAQDAHQEEGDDGQES